MNYYISLLSETTSTTSGSGDDIASLSEMTSGVTSIAEAISEYGVVIVLMAIFFVIFLAMVLLVLRSNAKMMTQIMKRNDSSDKITEDIVSKFVENALNKQSAQTDQTLDKAVEELKQAIKPLENTVKDLEKKQEDTAKHSATIEMERAEDDGYHKDLVGAYIDVNMALKDASRDALNKLKCERIAIYVFHNGNASMHGLPFFKMSCIHEWTARGSSTLRGKYHVDVPLHLFYDFIENLYTDRVYKTDDVEKAIKDDPSIEEFIAFSNTKALYMVAVTDDDDKLAGFVVAEFVHTDTFYTNSDREKEIRRVLEEMSNKISPIVTSHYVYKGKEKQQ